MLKGAGENTYALVDTTFGLFFSLLFILVFECVFACICIWMEFHQGGVHLDSFFFMLGGEDVKMERGKNMRGRRKKYNKGWPMLA